MNTPPIHIVYDISSLSVTDITGKRVINIVKKHIEDHSPEAEKHDSLTTEIYFLSAEVKDIADDKVIKLIKY